MTPDEFIFESLPEDVVATMQVRDEFGYGGYRAPTTDSSSLSAMCRSGGQGSRSE